MKPDQAESPQSNLRASFNKAPFPVTLCMSLAVILAGCSSGTSGNSGSSGNSTQTTAPVLTSIGPPGAFTGSAAITLNANGSNFVSGSQIEWNGSPLTTTYVSPVLLTAQLPASDMVAGGPNQVTVFTPGAGGGTSNAQTFSVTYPPPQLTSISPGSATVGSAAITLTAIGLGYIPGSQIEWNGTVLATTYISGTQLTAQIPTSDLAAPASALISIVNPTPGGGQSVGQFFTVNPGTTQLKVIASAANDIAWDSTRSIFYASQTGANGTGGSIMTINPFNGTVGTPQPAGNIPNLIALSSDASYLWVGQNGDNALQRFVLPNLTPDVKFTLSASSTTSAQAIGLRAAPNSPKSVAVLSGNVNYPGFSGNSLVVYNDTTPQQLNFGSDLISFDWGANASILDASQGTYASTSLTTANVTSSGVSSINNYPYDFPAAYPATQKIHFDQLTGYLYSDGGQVVNPATGDVIGSFNLSGFLSEYVPTLCVVDSSIVFFLGQTEKQYSHNAGYTIQAFDKTTYRLLGSLNIPQSTGSPVDFVRWGNAGLAFNVVPSSTVNLPSAIYLVDGSFVNSSQPADFSNGSGVSLFPNLTTMNPQIASVGAADTTVTLFGTNFVPGTTAFWYTPASPNPISLKTVYVSSGQLQATIPASLLTASGTDAITVSNSLPAASASQNALTFTVSSSPFTVMNLNTLDLAWDQNSSLLYASVWSVDAQYPNSIVAINPNTAQVVKSQFTGPDPYLVRPSADGKYLYTAFMAKNAVTQLQLPALNSPLSWSLGAHPKAGPFLAVDLQPAPGASQTTAITVVPSPIDLSYPLRGGGIGNLTIFDNNVARPVNLKANGTSTSDELFYDVLQWGANNSTLYSEDNASWTDLNNLAVNSSGVSLLQTYPNAVNDRSSPANPDPLFGTGTNIHFDAGTGYIYDDEGDAIDPATAKLINSYYASGLVVPDSTTNRVYILGQTQAQRDASQFGVHGYTIESFDQKLYTPLSSITLSGIQGTPLAMVRWGSSGLAFITYSSLNTGVSGDLTTPGMLYIVNVSNFSPSGQTPTQSAPSIEPVHRTWTKPHIPVPNSPQPKNQSTQPPTQSR